MYWLSQRQKEDPVSVRYKLDESDACTDWHNAKQK